MKDTNTGLEADGSSGTYHMEMKTIAFASLMHSSDSHDCWSSLAYTKATALHGHYSTTIMWHQLWFHAVALSICRHYEESTVHFHTSAPEWRLQKSDCCLIQTRLCLRSDSGKLTTKGSGVLKNTKLWRKRLLSSKYKDNLRGTFPDIHTWDALKLDQEGPFGNGPSFLFPSNQNSVATSVLHMEAKRGSNWSSEQLSLRFGSFHTTWVHSTICLTSPFANSFIWCKKENVLPSIPLAHQLAIPPGGNNITNFWVVLGGLNYMFSKVPGT